MQRAEKIEPARDQLVQAQARIWRLFPKSEEIPEYQRRGGEKVIGFRPTKGPQPIRAAFRHRELPPSRGAYSSVAHADCSLSTRRCMAGAALRRSGGALQCCPVGPDSRAREA